LREWIDRGRVTLDGEVAPATRRVRGGERVVVSSEPDPREVAFEPEPIALRIVHEDAALLVVDKPAGLVVHPGSGNWHGTLANALINHAPQLAAIPRAGIVHRLDKDTSGLMVVAKTLPAQTALVRELQARSVTREYIALASGDIATRGSIDAPIGRHPTRRTTMAVVATGKPARTHFDIVERFGVATLLRCSLETGRTHQIRVHLASLGHPLVGDPTYGRKGPLPFVRQALHAARLALVHPVTGKTCRWDSPLPPDFATLLDSLSARGSR
jgi:23S rRNA pseudouridine1911/1915/1917 synthase